MTDNNDLVAQLSKRIDSLKTGNQIHRAVAIELSMWREAFKADQQKQYQKGKKDGVLLRQKVSDNIDKTIAEIRKEEYEKGRLSAQNASWQHSIDFAKQQERDRIKEAVEKYHNSYEGDTLIICTMAEFDEILEGKTECQTAKDSILG